MWPPQTDMSFVDWLDREYGAEKRAFLSSRISSSDYEASAVWSMVLVHAWRRGVSFASFSTRFHLENWLKGRIRWARRLRRIDDARLRRRFALIDYWSDVQAPVQSSDGNWKDQRLHDAWESLSPKRRASIECLVIAGMRTIDAAQLLSVRQNTVCENKRQGLEELRRRYHGTHVSRADAVRAANRRKLAAS